MKLMTAAARCGEFDLPSTLTAAEPAAPKPGPGPGRRPPCTRHRARDLEGHHRNRDLPDDAPKTVDTSSTEKKNFYNGHVPSRRGNFLVQMATRLGTCRRKLVGPRPGAATDWRRDITSAGSTCRHGGDGPFGDPKFADSQFYMVIQPRPGLDGKYAIFGRVTTGLDVVKKLKRADILKKASVK